MKLSTIAFVFCCILSICYGLYSKYFADAYKAYSRISQAREGMTQQQVRAALSQPDSTYWEQSDDDSLLIMSYTLPDTDGSTILVKLRDDTVRSVKYHK